jgi:hypothetical protein
MVLSAMNTWLVHSFSSSEPSYERHTALSLYTFVYSASKRFPEARFWITAGLPTTQK